MVTGYNDTPQTLDELIQQSNEWDGDVVAVVPGFMRFDVQPGEFKPDRLDWVTLKIKNDDGNVWDSIWRLTNRGWVLSCDDDCPPYDAATATGMYDR